MNKNVPANLVRNKYVTAIPKSEWHVDGSLLEVRHKGRPESRHWMLLGVDPTTNMVVICKCFYAKHSKDTPSAQQCLKVLKKALTTHKIVDNLIVHTDRGGQFMADVWKLFFEEFPHFERSATDGGAPTQNAVAERMIETIKYRLMSKFKTEPAYIRDTKQLNRALFKIETDHNLYSRPERNLELPPFETQMILQSSQVEMPEQTEAVRGAPIRENPDARAIDLYREKALQDPDVKITDPEIVEAYSETALESDPDNNQKVDYSPQELKENIHDIQGSVSRIEKYVTPKQKKKHKGVPKRDAIPRTIFNQILASEKPTNFNQRNWSRFLLAISLLYFSGMRINETALLTASQIEEIFATGKLRVYQSKVDEYRTITFIDAAIRIIKKVYEEHKGFIFGSHEHLYPLRPDGSPNGEKFVNIINKQLKIYGDEHGLNLKSHSFRINYVTAILPHATVQDVQIMVGHKDIRSTIAYSRYQLKDKTRTNILQKGFDEDENSDI